jgi:hypothetical protein
MSDYKILKSIPKNDSRALVFFIETTLKDRTYKNLNEEIIEKKDELKVIEKSKKNI